MEDDEKIYMGQQVALQSSHLGVRLIAIWAPIGLRVGMGEFVGL
jgi:hypothetical protein